MLPRQIPHYKITTKGITLLLQDFLCCGIFFSSLTECASLVCTSSLVHWFWWAHALAYFPFQSHLWLWHSTASLLVMWSRAMLTEIVDAWNSLQPTGHFGFAVDLVSCLRQTRIPNPEWPQLQLPGFNMALKLYGLGKKSIIIVSLEYTTLFHVMCNLPTYCIVIVGLWNQ